MESTVRGDARMTCAAPLGEGLALGEVALDVDERRGGEGGGGHETSLLPRHPRRIGDIPPDLDPGAGADVTGVLEATATHGTGWSVTRRRRAAAERAHRPYQAVGPGCSSELIRRELPRIAAPAQTPATESASGSPPMGEDAQLSPTRTGAARTGTTTGTT